MKSPLIHLVPSKLAATGADLAAQLSDHRHSLVRTQRDVLHRPDSFTALTYTRIVYTMFVLGVSKSQVLTSPFPFAIAGRHLFLQDGSLSIRGRIGGTRELKSLLALVAGST